KLIMPYLHVELARQPAGRPLHLTVERGGRPQEIQFTPPPSLPLHPAQLYSSLDGLLMFLFLSAFYPLRGRYGEVTVLLMIFYAINRISIEQLRNDTPAAFLFHMTLSQTISLFTLMAAAGLYVYIRRTQPLLSESAPVAKP